MSRENLLDKHLFVPRRLFTVIFWARRSVTGNEPADATIEADGDQVVATFDVPQRAITPGQAVVFYEGDVVVEGGWIA